MMRRRAFMGTLAGAGVFFIPATKLFGQELPKKQIRLAVVGAGGIGVMTRNELQRAGATVAALCDVDRNRLGEQAKHFPGIPTYTDWREMFRHEKDFDAVAVATPDHTHAIVGLNAMRLGKHVYIQKPLAHTFEECKMLMAEQKRRGVVAQMGNQHHPRGKAYKVLIDANVIGNVKKVYCWTDRPAGWWPQGMQAYPAEQMIPGYSKETWDIWVGPSACHPCNPALAPFKWRGWWDYGCGAIGDMAIHNADPAFETLELGLPIAVTATADSPVTVAYPLNGKIELTFGPTPKCPNGVTLTWTNSSKAPDRGQIAGLHPNYQFDKNGLLFEGEKGAFNGIIYENNPSIISYGGHDWNAESKEVQTEWAQKLRELKYHNHYVQFIQAIRDGKPEDCGSRMSYAAPFTQALLIGAIALRFPGQTLRFDPATERFTNCDAANAFLKAPSRGDFSMKDFA